MTAARFLVGDVFDRMAELPAGSVDLVLTSPPFLALRSYLPADHPDKAREIGSEPDPAAFLDTLLELTAEWGRLLAPHGSIAVELGDTYAGADNSPSTTRNPAYGQDGKRFAERAAAAPRKRALGTGWPLAKSLCGIPHLYHLSLAYGRNLLTGEPSPAGQWRVRNVVAWCRPNPPVGALGDKYRPATSYMTVACKGATRWFDLDAVRTEHRAYTRQTTMGTDPNSRNDGGDIARYSSHHPAGAPPLDWWEIPSQPYAGAHYATWPTALCERPIKSMCPRRVCEVCGTPSTRGARSYVADFSGGSAGGRRDASEPDSNDRGIHSRRMAAVPSNEWSDCGHDAWRNGLVLDPFAGSGTTLAVATGHGRDAIGIDLDVRNAELARQRVGMFLTVEDETGIA